MIIFEILTIFWAVGRVKSEQKCGKPFKMDLALMIDAGSDITEETVCTVCFYKPKFK
jgi:hypothetical protein